MAPKAVDVLILGGGPAGLTAGLYAARAGARTVVIEPLASGGQINLTPEIENFPGHVKIAGDELGQIMLTQAELAGVEIAYTELQSLDLEKKHVVCLDAEYQYKSLIIATGQSPRKLGLPNEEEFVGNGIHFCGLCDGNFYRGRDILVVGGGNHAVEEAIYLSKIAKSVTMVTDTDRLLAQAANINMLPKDVKIHYTAHIAEIRADKKIKGVKLDTGAELAVDAIFVAIGRVPNTDMFRGKLNLSRSGHIIVDATMKTSVPSVFAAGDVCDKAIKQVITACSDGAIAASYAVRF